MEESFRLGRIAGVRVGMNWSLLVVAWLIAWSLAGTQLPGGYPGYTTATYWTAGVIASLAFFASLLGHEMAHALQARREGVEVEGITLWLFGGVARMRGDAMNARSEFRIAIVGPLTSLVIGAAFYIVGLVVATLGASDLLVGTLYWLARINAILAVFNMIPAFPLDGGRVFRAWLWRTRDKMQATRIAARAGKAFGFLLIALGLIQFAFSAELGGLWLVFVGYFLTNAARAEESHVLLAGALSGLQVRDIMSTEVVTVPGWVTLDVFIHDYAMRYRFTAFPVQGTDGDTEGLVTLGRAKEVPAEERAQAQVRSVAYPMAEVPVGDPREALTALLDRISGSPHGRALILDQGHLVGIVSPRDVAKALDMAALKVKPVPHAGLGPP